MTPSASYMSVPILSVKQADGYITMETFCPRSSQAEMKSAFVAAAKNSNNATGSRNQAATPR